LCSVGAFSTSAPQGWESCIYLHIPDCLEQLLKAIISLYNRKQFIATPLIAELNIAAIGLNFHQLLVTVAFT